MCGCRAGRRTVGRARARLVGRGGGAARGDEETVRRRRGEKRGRGTFPRTLSTAAESATAVAVVAPAMRPAGAGPTSVACSGRSAMSCFDGGVDGRLGGVLVGGGRGRGARKGGGSGGSEEDREREAGEGLEDLRPEDGRRCRRRGQSLRNLQGRMREGMKRHAPGPTGSPSTRSRPSTRAPRPRPRPPGRLGARSPACSRSSLAAASTAAASRPRTTALRPIALSAPRGRPPRPRRCARPSATRA